MSDVDAMVGWLRSVWDADEKAALPATEGTWLRWHDQERIPGWDGFIVIGDDAEEGEECNPVARVYTETDAAHIARHDPRDTLARIDGERALVAAYEQRAAWAAKPGVGDRSLGCLSGLEQAVRALASGYRHRAGWQEGWAT